MMSDSKVVEIQGLSNKAPKHKNKYAKALFKQCVAYYALSFSEEEPFNQFKLRMRPALRCAYYYQQNLLEYCYLNSESYCFRPEHYADMQESLVNVYHYFLALDIEDVRYFYRDFWRCHYNKVAVHG